MSYFLTYWLLSGFILGACLFAFWKGDAGVRTGAAVILGMILVERISRATLGLPHSWNLVVGMAGDTITAFGLLFIAARYATPWLGGVLLFYAAQFAIHAFYFVTHRPDDAFRFVTVNTCFMAVNICLVGGAIAAIRARGARRQALAGASEKLAAV